MKLYLIEPYFRPISDVNLSGASVKVERDDNSYRVRNIASGKIEIYGDDFDWFVGLDLSICVFSIVRNSESFEFMAEIDGSINYSEKKVEIKPKISDKYTKLYDLYDKDFNIAEVIAEPDIDFEVQTDIERITKTFIVDEKIDGALSFYTKEFITDEATGEPLEFIDYEMLGLDPLVWGVKIAIYDIINIKEFTYYNEPFNKALFVRWNIGVVFITQVAYGYYGQNGNRIPPSADFIFIEDVVRNGVLTPKYGKKISYSPSLWQNTDRFFTIALKNFWIYVDPAPNNLELNSYSYVYPTDASKPVNLSRGRKLTNVIKYLVQQIDPTIVNFDFSKLNTVFEDNTLLLFGLSDVIPNDSGEQKEIAQTVANLSLEKIFNFLKTESFFSIDWILDGNAFKIIQLSDYNNFTASTSNIYDKKGTIIQRTPYPFTRVKQQTFSISENFRGDEASFLTDTENKLYTVNLNTIYVDYSYIYTNYTDFDALSVEQFVLIAVKSNKVQNQNAIMGFKNAISKHFAECPTENLTLYDKTNISVAANRIRTDKTIEISKKYAYIQDVNLLQTYNFNGFFAKIISIENKDRNYSTLKLELK